jgi:hypothetical protein
MKKISFFLITVLCITGVTITLSFKGSDTKQKPFTLTTFYYVEDGQRIDPGYNFECTYLSSFWGPVFTNSTSWTTTAPGSPNECENDNHGDYLCSIAFDLEATADGGSDGQLTLQEGVNAVWAYYNAQTPKSLPCCVAAPLIMEGNTTIYIHRKRDAFLCP